MALVTAYLARTAQLSSARAVAAPVVAVFNSIAAFIKVSGQAITEARAMERAMRRKYPFLDN